MWLYHLLSSFACICFWFFLLKEVFIFISIIHKYSLFLFEYERYSALVSPSVCLVRCRFLPNWCWFSLCNSMDWFLVSSDAAIGWINTASNWQYDVADLMTSENFNLVLVSSFCLQISLAILMKYKRSYLF